ncbi:hydroxyacylglutathione hydrolase [Pseudodonghicola xiamenensis]|nr:hydroxyacylglutathione hydrolase [Pseudodonghicola xiamenensis]
MPLEILTIPCLSDNYAFLAHDATTGETALIDAPEAAPILQALVASGWRLTQVLLTHHHWDHVEGLADILKAWPEAKVTGAAADAHRLPPLDVQVHEGDTVSIGAEQGRVLDVSGHTVGHIAYFFPASHAVFTADSLMALGCGRVFEGTLPMMWASLSKLAALPPETVVYSGHEYTQANGRFAETVDPGNPALSARIAEIAAARARGEATVPSTLAQELATNPFLRAADPAIRKHLGMETASDAEVFGEIRSRKDKF